MRALIIGCGLIGHKRVQNSKNVEFVGCIDANILTAQTFANKYNIPNFFGSFNDLLDAKIEFDIAIIATPHNILPDLIRQCVLLNKHVLVEKPAARFPHELSEIIKLANASSSKVRIGFNHRYHRAFRKAKEIFNSEVLGDLYFIRARYGHGGRLGYNKEWRANPDISGGGELIDQGSHLIDLSRMFLGDFDEINGSAKNYFWDMPVDDNAFLHLVTSKNQVAFLQVSCSEWKNTFSFELYGKNGKLEVNGLGGSYGIEKLTYYKMLPEMGPPETISWEFPMFDDSWSFEFNEFLEDITKDRHVNPGLLDAYENLIIIDKIYKLSNYDFYSKPA